MPPRYLREQKDGSLTLSVWAQPNAKKNEIVGEQGDFLKIKVASPPIEGAANEALRDFLSEVLEVPRRQVILLRGETSKQKIFKIEGLSPEQAVKNLNLSLDP